MQRTASLNGKAIQLFGVSLKLKEAIGNNDLPTIKNLPRNKHTLSIFVNFALCLLDILLIDEKIVLEQLG